MPQRLLRDVAPGTLVLVRDKVGAPPKGVPGAEQEYREILYLCEGGRDVRYDYNVTIARIRVVQGTRGPNPPRYDFGEQECRDPGEADGRTPVLEPHESYFPMMVLVAESYRCRTGVD